MTTNPKTRRAPANGAELDPILAAIAEHKVLIEKSNRLKKSCETAREKAEKNGIMAQLPQEFLGGHPQLSGA